jgi:hypothetical protein
MIKKAESFYFGLAGLIVTLVANYIFRIQMAYVAVPLSYVGAGLAITSLVKVWQVSKEEDISGLPTVGIVLAVFALLAFAPFLLLTYAIVFGFNIGW